MPNDANVFLKFRRPNHVRVTVALDADLRTANLRSPVQSVGRKPDQLHVTDLRCVERLVTPRRVFLVRVLVHTGSGRAAHDNVVSLVTSELDQTKLWFFPMNTVLGCGVKDRFVALVRLGRHVVGGRRFALGRRCLGCSLVDDERAVPAFVKFFLRIKNDVRIHVVVARFPRFVGDEQRVGRVFFYRAKRQPCIYRRVDNPRVKEQKSIPRNRLGCRFLFAATDQCPIRDRFNLLAKLDHWHLLR